MNDAIATILHAALRGLSARQNVTADNIANADTPGFKASDVRFEDRLKRALRDSTNPTALLAEAAPIVETQPGRVARFDQSSVDLDHELLTMTDTTMRYNAVAQLMSERIALYRAVITDGRG